MRVIDCQGLAGAFTLGCVQAGFELVGVKSLPGGFGVPNLEANRALLGDDWRAEVGPQEEWMAAHAELVAGNPPCSGFSGLNTSGKANKRGPGSKINDCMWAFARYVARVYPQVAIFESVPAAGKEKTGGRALMRALWQHVRAETGAPYKLTHVFMSGSAVGAAQYRHRYFWTLSLDRFGVDLPKLDVIGTYRHAIGDLVGLECDWEPQEYAREAISARAKNRRDPRGVVDSHVWPDATPLTIRLQPLMRYWYPGEDLKQAARRYDQHHKMPPGWSAKNWRSLLDPTHFTINGTVRVEWDKPGYVITGAGGIAFIHPEENRPLSLRECARLMGFPDTWTWTAAKSVGQGYMWVGKQIPVESGNWMANWAKQSIAGFPGRIRGEPTDLPDEYVIDVTNVYKEQLRSQLGSTS